MKMRGIAAISNWVKSAVSQWTGSKENGREIMSLEEFRALIAEISRVPLSKVREKASLRDDLGIDSLQLVNLITVLTERLKTDFSQIQSMGDIETVEKLYKTLVKRS